MPKPSENAYHFDHTQGNGKGKSRRVWKVGELAERTGLTVRTLHHYDTIGLLSPSGRTESHRQAGHRLYTPEDLARLQQILSLKQLGFGLDDIKDMLAGADFQPVRILRMHWEHVRRQADTFAKLADRLAALADALERAEVISPEDFLNTIEEIAMFEKYYTPEQLEQLKVRGELVGPERMLSVQNDWALLHARVNSLINDGVPPADPRAQDAAQTWFNLINEFTGGDPGISKSLANMYKNETQIRGADVAAMQPMMEYVRQAAAAAGISMPGL